MAFEIQISEETVDKLVVDVLRNTLERVRQEIHRLQDKAELKSYQQEDLAHGLSMEQHLMAVIRYFTPPSEHDQI